MDNTTKPLLHPRRNGAIVPGEKSIFDHQSPGIHCPSADYRREGGDREKDTDRQRQTD